MRKSFLAGLGLSLLVCASVHAQDYFGTLTGSQENPPNASPGTGGGTLDYDPATQLLTVSMTYSGLVAPATDAHIHAASTSVSTNAIVAIGFTGAGGFVTGATSGNYNHVFDLSQASTYSAAYITASGGTVVQARDRLLNAFDTGVATNSNVAYFNIHSSFAPGGEIRGNIAPIPEPATASIVAGGLTLLGIARPRRSPRTHRAR